MLRDAFAVSLNVWSWYKVSGQALGEQNHAYLPCSLMFLKFLPCHSVVLVPYKA